MKITFLAASVAVLAMTVMPAVFDGGRRFRWGHDSEIMDMAARLNDFPRQIGSWEAISDFEMGESAADQLQPVATISRCYFSADRQQQMQVFILLGPTGPTAAHTPDICFSSRDYRKIGERRRATVAPDSSCFVTRFESRDANAHYLKSWYAWTVDGNWQAPDRPRFFFARSRFLVKIQITSQYVGQNIMENDLSADEFVADIQRILKDELF